MKTSKTLILTEAAIMLALAVALSFVKIIKMPFGGSVTLMSMLPIALFSIKRGIKWGFFTAFLYAVIHLCMSLGEILTWSLTPAVFAGTVLYDYILAYAVLGLAGKFGKNSYEGKALGVTFALTMRFFCHFVSGIVLWGEYKAHYDWAENMNVAVYSLVYNGIYMFPEILFTSIVGFILLNMPYVRKLFTSDDFSDN
jgi:thiamine transporter